MAHVLDLRDLELQLVKAEFGICLPCLLHHLMQGLIMLCLVFARYDDVVCYDVHVRYVTEGLIISLLRTSLADDMPKGMRRNRFLPQGVWEVYKYDDSSLSFTCQKASLMSTTVNTRFPASFL